MAQVHTHVRGFGAGERLLSPENPKCMCCA